MVFNADIGMNEGEPFYLRYRAVADLLSSTTGKIKNLKELERKVMLLIF